MSPNALYTADTGALFPLDRQLEIKSDTKPLTHTSSIRVYLQLAEDNIFLQGFDHNSFEGRPPTILRGALVVRVLKPTKIKSLTLTFKGIARTDWPEGIPPKKNEYVEENVVITHTWPFFSQCTGGTNSGADIVRSPQGLYAVHSNLGVLSHEDVSSLNLDAASQTTTTNAKANPFSLLKKVASPERNRSNSLISSMSNENLGDSHYVFEQGDYVYNFEHPIQASTPESIEATFGSVRYYLEVLIERSGAFKSNISAKMPVTIIRAQCDESVEDSEPIAISRDWEDQLHYDILIASKAMILDAYIPIAFKLIPLDKIKLHRIRVYVTENVEYYCRNKKVHRMEPTRKFLLLEHRAPPPKDAPPNADPKTKKMGNLLTSDGYDLTAKEFEFQLFVPEKLNGTQKLHPNTSYQNIKAHHWIKICLRLSRVIDGKPKHYEISIDSPIHVLHSKCSHANTLLPAYGIPQFDSTHCNHDSNIYFPKDIVDSPPLSPEVEAVDVNHRSIYLALNGSRSRSSSSLSHSLPNFESTLSANLYKPHEIHKELTSPQALPLSPMLSPMLSVTSDRDDDLPPPFDDDLQSLSPVQPHGIDAIMDTASPPLKNPPKNPPSYDEIMDTTSPRLRSIIVPHIELTRASESPNTPTGDPNDLASDFSFGGTSPIMPSSVMRATAPEAQLIRASVRSAASTPRASLDLNRTSPRPSAEFSVRGSNEIDNILSDHEDEDEETPVVVAQPIGSPVSRTSSISPSTNTTVPYIDEDIADMAPLLNTTSTVDSIDAFNPTRFQSVESFPRRESQSADISGLYQSPQNIFTGSSIFDSPFVSQRQPSFSAPPVRPVSGVRRLSSAQTANPVMAVLGGDDQDEIIEESESVANSPSDSSTFQENDHSSSTLASGGGDVAVTGVRKPSPINIDSSGADAHNESAQVPS